MIGRRLRRDEAGVGSAKWCAVVVFVCLLNVCFGGSGGNGGRGKNDAKIYQ